MKKKKPKLILCDVDGTLIDSTQAVTPAFAELKDLIASCNLCFSLASGRSFYTLKQYVEALEINAPVLINNGAGAVQDGKVLWSEFLQPLCIQEAVFAADELGMAIFFCWGDGSETVYRYNAYIQKEMDLYERYNYFYIPLKKEWPHLKLERVMITDPQKNGRIEQILPCLNRYAGQVRILPYDARHVDVMPKGMSKGDAIRRLARHLQIGMEDILAIGDGANDIEMLRMAGTGAAVGNASEELKHAADYVCTENNTRGVIEAIRKFCTD